MFTILRPVALGPLLAIVLVSAAQQPGRVMAAGMPQVAVRGTPDAHVALSHLPLGARSKPGKGGSLPGDHNPPIYWDTIKIHVAHRLHRSVSALTKLWGSHSVAAGSKGSPSQPPVTIYDVAVQQGLSRQQLRKLEIDAIQAGWNVVVGRHVVSRRQANHAMAIIKSWDGNNLDGYTMYAFGHA